MSAWSIYESTHFGGLVFTLLGNGYLEMIHLLYLIRQLFYLSTIEWNWPHQAFTVRVDSA